MDLLVLTIYSLPEGKVDTYHRKAVFLLVLNPVRVLWKYFQVWLPFSFVKTLYYTVSMSWNSLNGKEFGCCCFKGVWDLIWRLMGNHLLRKHFSYQLVMWLEIPHLL